MFAEESDVISGIGGIPFDLHSGVLHYLRIIKFKILATFVYFTYFEFTRAFLQFYQHSSQDTKQIVTRSATRARFYNRRLT